MNCYVLIGGRSSRMGESKIALFLPYVVAAARPVFDQIIAVQRANGAAADIETIFEAPRDEQAPAFGVARALEHANGDCFILAVDYPLIRTDVLRYIVERPRGDLVVPRWNGKLQVLCGVYGKAMRAILDRRLAAGRYDLRGLGDRADIIEEAELRARFAGEPLMNVNTPGEWAEAKALL